jgi:hypothetical protein
MSSLAAAQPRSITTTAARLQYLYVTAAPPGQRTEIESISPPPPVPPRNPDPGEFNQYSCTRPPPSSGDMPPSWLSNPLCAYTLESLRAYAPP